MRMAFKPLATIALAAALGLGTTALAGPSLEQLFEQGRFDEFLMRAHDGAVAGDVDALFLLGKAHDLGRGVAADADKARFYYERARALGSARASHNLGVLALTAGDTGDAIDLLEEALARGLRMPTLYNLGRAYTPPDPTSTFGLPAYVDGARTAGDYYARACAEVEEPGCIEDAARQFTRAYMIARQSPHAQEETLAGLRGSALTWLRKGMDNDDGIAWTNYGVLLMLDGDDAGAREALEVGVAREVPVAYYQLARLAADGKGFEKREPALALDLYEKAAAQGVTDALRPAFELLSEQLQYEDDPVALEQGLQRLAALRPEPGFGDWRVGRLDERLAWLRFHARERQAPMTLPAAELAVALDACGLGLAQDHGATYNIGVNSHWRLVAYPEADEVERLPIEGVVDADGCVRLPLPADATLHGLLQRRAVFALAFPNFSLPLTLRVDGDAAVFHLQPLGAPLPPR